MAEKRKGSCFRLPWLQATPAPAPRQQTQVPSTESQMPTTPTTTTPAQKPPFRPPKSSPTQATPPQAQAPPTNESQPSPTSSTTTRSRVTSQTASPSRLATQSRAASKPRPPSRTSTQSRAATQPLSPSHATPQPQATTQPQASSQPLSTTRTASKTQPASQADPQPQSPPKWASQPAQSSAGAVDQLPLPSEKLQPIIQEGLEPPPPDSTEPPLSVSQEQPKAARSQRESQELQPNPNGKPALPSEASAPVTEPTPTFTAAVQTPAPTQKSDSSLVNAETNPHQQSDGNPETIEGKQIMQEYRNKQKINGATEEPKQKTVTELLTAASGSEVLTKVHPSVAFDEEQKQLEKEEAMSGEETIATSSSKEKQTKTVISNVRDKNTVSQSHHNPIISNGERVPLHKEIKEDISKFIRDMTTQQPKHPLDDRPVSAITLSGENRGATIKLGSESAKREEAVHIRRGYKINPDESIEASTDREGSSKGKLEDSKTEDNQASKAYINSIVQGINNSIMFNSSVTERNLDVQLVHSRNRREPVESIKQIESLETTHKATPLQAQAPPINESQPSPTSSTTTRSRVTSQTAPPSRVATQSQAASKPRPPFRTSTQSRAAIQPPSPSRATPQPQATTQPQASSQPLSTTRTASETQPASQADPQPQSPPKWASQPAQSSTGAVDQLSLPSEKLQPITQDGFEPPPPGSTEPPLSVAQEEPMAARSQPESQELQPESQELQPKAERTSENVLNAQNQMPSQMTSHPNGKPAPPSEASALVTETTPTSTAAVQAPAPTQKSDSSLFNAETNPCQQSNGNLETIEGKQIMQEYRNKRKINGATEEPKQKTVTERLTAASGSEELTKVHPSVAFDEEQKQLEKEDVISGEETIATSSSKEKQTKTVISNVRDKNTVCESHHNPIVSNGERVPLHKENEKDISKFIRDMTTQQPKHPLDDRPVSVITLSGENRGASMKLGSESAKREEAVHIHRGYKINPDESIEASTDEEGSSKERLEDSTTEDDQASKAYINSNVQGINNSIMFNSSVTKRNPGVQLVLSCNQREPVGPTKQIESLETTHKAKFNVTPAQKLTCEPTVRRRCLKGLFLESNDSASDYPDKPQRHGCRYVCKNCKDKKMDIL